MPLVVRHRWFALARDLAWALAPGVAMALALPFAAPGGAGRFQVALAGLVTACVVGAFAASAAPAAAARRVGLAAAVGAAGTALLGGGAFAGAVLFLGAGGASSGLAALGRRLGTPSVPAAAVATGVLLAACAGLFWADPTAAFLPRSERRPWRQAVLHADPSLALAQDALGYDRLRAPEVYFEVPLASGLYEAPRAATTGAAWLAVGLLAWAGALAARRGRKVRGTAALSGMGTGEEGGREKSRGDTGRPPRHEL